MADKTTAVTIDGGFLTWTDRARSEAERAALAVADAEHALARATERRDQMVRTLVGDGVPVIAVAEAFNLTRSRVYQIRDGRR